MKNKEIYAGIILLIAIILAGQAIEPRQITNSPIQTQSNEQHTDKQNNTTPNTADAPETNLTNNIETGNETPDEVQTIPNCTGSYGLLIKTTGNETYALWDLNAFTDSVKIYSTQNTATPYQVYAAKKLSGPWFAGTENARITTENSTTAIYLLPGTYKYIKVEANDSLNSYEAYLIEKCVGGKEGNLEGKVKYIDAIESLGKGRGGCGCEDSTPCTTTTSTTPTTTSTSSTTTTEPTTSTTTSSTSTTTTTSSTTTTTIPNAPEFSSVGGLLSMLLLMPAFAYLAVRRKK